MIIYRYVDAIAVALVSLALTFDSTALECAAHFLRVIGEIIRARHLKNN